MRRILLGIVVSALLFVSLLGTCAAGEGYSVLVPGMTTGCFGEVYPVLNLVPEYGGGNGNGGMHASPSMPQMPPAAEKPGDKEDGPELLQLMSRPGRPAAAPAREVTANAKVRRVSRAIDLRGLTAKDAEPMFWKGYRLYFAGQPEEALPLFEAATQLSEDDARFWYFRSLTESAAGRDKLAEASRDRAAELHLRGLPNQEAIGKVLERVQGEPRQKLREALNAAAARRPS